MEECFERLEKKFHSDAKDEFLAMFSNVFPSALEALLLSRGRYLHEKRVNFFVTNASPPMTGP